MLLCEWERAVKDAEEVYNVVAAKAGKEFPRRPLFNFWLKDLIATSGLVVYDVAQVFYASDSLNNVPGINGPNRHTVFVAWMSDNRQKICDAVSDVEAAMQTARREALDSIAVKLDPRRRA